MDRVLTRSNAHFRKASERLPLGVASNFRYWGDDRTIYIRQGKGARLWDIDGNAYIDYRLGYGPAILGYANDEVDAAARNGASVGGVFALATERELSVAERICRMVPSAEMVRYSNSGTEAVMAALRLARAYTGKDSYILIEGGYHGVFDAVLWAADVEGWSGRGQPPVVPYGEGVPMMLKQLLYRVPLNDANVLEDVLRKHSDQIAALLVEPIMGNCCGIMADPQYVRDVRALCTRYDVVMVVDEVKTGFRVARGGVQELMGFKADLTTFAKALANGYPISVLAGRRDIMSKIGDTVVHGGTYTAHSVSLAAAEKTLQILEETDALERIERYGLDLREGMSRILDARGIPHTFVGHPSMSGLFFSESAPQNYRDWRDSDYAFYDALAESLHDRGVLCEPDSREPWFVSAAHDASCLSETLHAFEEAVDATAARLEKAASGAVA